MTSSLTSRFPALPIPYYKLDVFLQVAEGHQRASESAAAHGPGTVPTEWKLITSLENTVYTKTVNAEEKTVNIKEETVNTKEETVNTKRKRGLVESEEEQKDKEIKGRGAHKRGRQSKKR